ncbi:hypothetical protein NQ317_019505 [Molorchus minor]|uniref:Uncharacterized protein n=1 Tax=Molorchus minor TaxID=1323400 RepID=A0ABQ9JXA3_9CUCU|nr:hypothetical protein NQ317_019505 [Molorchus minor]
MKLSGNNVYSRLRLSVTCSSNNKPIGPSGSLTIKLQDTYLPYISQSSGHFLRYVTHSSSVQEAISADMKGKDELTSFEKSSLNHKKSKNNILTQMADPGESLLCPYQVHCDSFSKIQGSKEVVLAFLKYPQFPLVQMLMKELNLCAHDHSFVPPW